MYAGIKEAAKSKYDDMLGARMAKQVAAMPEGKRRAFIAAVVQMVGVAAVTIIVMIFIISEIITVMPAPSDSGLANATAGIISIVGSSFTLAGVALVVIIAGAILFYVGNFGRDSGMR
jgi:hypothetical protein